MVYFCQKLLHMARWHFCKAIEPRLCVESMQSACSDRSKVIAPADVRCAAIVMIAFDA
jgi:hypothetical protein